MTKTTRPIPSTSSPSASTRSRRASRRSFLRTTAALGLAVASGLALWPRSLHAAPPRPGDPSFAEYVLNRVDDIHRGRSSHARMRMQVKTHRWKRSMAMEAWSLGDAYSLVRILEPKKERGTATLKANNDLFTYLSKTNRTIKISGASMGGSWMGSHFTNDDLVKNSRLADDFDHEIKPGPRIAGHDTWALVLSPKRHAIVVWGRVDVMVRRSDLLPVGVLFYDEDLHPVRKLEFFEYREVDGEQVPMRTRMSPLSKDEAGEYTEISYEQIEFDVDLKPADFSISRLESL